MPERPDFLCVGVQKGATSWLYISLLELSGVFVPLIKESHYFRESSRTPTPWAATLRRERARALMRAYTEQGRLPPRHREPLAQIRHFLVESVDDAWYRGVFSFARPDEIAGEVCPSYFGIDEPDIEHARRLNPALRVVLFVRDPVDRCWSHIRMHRRQQGESVDLDRVFGEPGGLDMYLDYTIYDRALPRWGRVMGDQLRMIVFDDVVERPAAVFREVLAHIGYRGEIETARPTGAKNIGEPSPMPVRRRAALYERLGPQYEHLSSLFPQRVAQWRARHEAALAARV